MRVLSFCIFFQALFLLGNNAEMKKLTILAPFFMIFACCKISILTLRALTLPVTLDFYVHLTLNKLYKKDFLDYNLLCLQLFPVSQFLRQRKALFICFAIHIYRHSLLFLPST